MTCAVLAVLAFLLGRWSARVTLRSPLGPISWVGEVGLARWGKRRIMIERDRSVFETRTLWPIVEGRHRCRWGDTGRLCGNRVHRAVEGAIARDHLLERVLEAG